MCVLPTVFLLTVDTFRHRTIVYLFIALGTFVVAGTTSSLPAISVRDMPIDLGSVWTPLRAVGYTALHWLAWYLVWPVLIPP